MVSPVPVRAGAAFLTLLLWAVMALLVEHLYRLEVDRAVEDLRADTLTRAATIRARLEAELNATLFISRGVIEYVTAHRDVADPDRVMAALQIIHRSGRHVRNVALAPGNVIQYVYPLSGNEEALGLDYRQNEAQWPEVVRAMEEQRTMLAGPLDLVQGGRGLIVRAPVFVGQDEYWGILSVVIDAASLFAGAGLAEPEHGIRYALRTGSARTRNDPPFFGTADVFSSNPVTLDVSIPGGAWTLAAIPEGGWRDASGVLSLYRIAGHLLVAIVAALAFTVLEERYRIARMALHDPLTELPNRRNFQDRLESELERAGREERSITLLYVDLNGFKEVNDRYGHGRGDAVLKTVADRMRGVLQGDEFLARVGGDEFVVLLPAVGTQAAAAERIRALRRAIARPMAGLALSGNLDAAIGVAIFPQDGADPESLMNAADRKMYGNKDVLAPDECQRPSE